MKSLLILTVLVSGCGAAHAGERAGSPRTVANRAAAANTAAGPSVRLAKFSRPGCMPCQQIAPAIHAMIREGLPVVEVDTVRRPDIARKYGATSVPTFVLMVGNKVAWRQVGVPNGDVAACERELRGRLRRAMAASAAIARKNATRTPAAPPTRSAGPEAAADRRFAAQSAAPPVRTASAEAPAPRPRERSPEVPLVLVDGSGRSVQPETKKRGFFDFFGGGDDEAQTVDDPFLAAAEEARANGQTSAPPFRTADAAAAATAGAGDAPAAWDGGAAETFTRDAVPATSSTAPSSDPLRTAVRIEVPDAGGVQFGSGTVIASRPGRSVVLSCGHVFKNHRPGGAITIYSWASGSPRPYPARLITADAVREVGLLEVDTPDPLPFSRLAPLDPGLARGDAVQSVGSADQAAPTKQNHRVLDLDLFTGPSTVACSGQPVEGRSGGGLFDARGELVGVCWAREETPPRGIYTAASVVHDVLDEADLSDLHPPRPRGSIPPADASPAVTRTQLAAADPPPASAGLTKTAAATSSNPFTDFGTPPAAAADEPMSPAVAALLAEADLSVPSSSATPAAASVPAASFPEGAVEITCVIRSVDNPDAPSEIVVIHRATPRTLRLLKGAAEGP